MNEVIISGESANGTIFSETFQNEFTFIEFTERLDGVTLFCGTGANLDVGRLFLRVYRKC